MTTIDLHSALLQVIQQQYTTALWLNTAQQQCNCRHTLFPTGLCFLTLLSCIMCHSSFMRLSAQKGLSSRSTAGTRLRCRSFHDMARCGAWCPSIERRGVTPTMILLLRQLLCLIAVLLARQLIASHGASTTRTHKPNENTQNVKSA